MPYHCTDTQTPQAGVTASETCVTAGETYVTSSETYVTSSETCVTSGEKCVTASEAWQSRLCKAQTVTPAGMDRHAALAMTRYAFAMTGWGSR